MSDPTSPDTATSELLSDEIERRVGEIEAEYEDDQRLPLRWVDEIRWLLTAFRESQAELSRCRSLLEARAASSQTEGQAP